MQIRWQGQSAFALRDGDTTVFIDPFDDLSGLEARGVQFDYPQIEGVVADLLLVTHEHSDHNGVGAIGGDPRTIRSTAGTSDDVLAIASEHDDAAGTKRGPNTTFRFEFGGARIAHFGDVDILFVPVGDGPMHYRTDAVNFLDPPDAFLDALGAEGTHADTEFDPSAHSGVVLPAVPQ